MKDEELVTMLTAPGKKRRERKVREEAASPTKEEDEDESDKDKGRIRGQSLEDIVKMAKIKRQLRQQAQT